nr:MAG TPA: hypothetical protein [Bacteriophage sp.]
MHAHNHTSISKFLLFSILHPHLEMGYIHHIFLNMCSIISN